MHFFLTFFDLCKNYFNIGPKMFVFSAIILAYFFRDFVQTDTVVLGSLSIQLPVFSLEVS